jgi:hypothetical protein
MELAVRADRAMERDTAFRFWLFIVPDDLGYPIAGLFTDAPTRVAAHRGKDFPFGPGQVGSSTAPAPTRQVSRRDARAGQLSRSAIRPSDAFTAK